MNIGVCEACHRIHDLRGGVCVACNESIRIPKEL